MENFYMHTNNPVFSDLGSNASKVERKIWLFP